MVPEAEIIIHADADQHNRDTDRGDTGSEGRQGDSDKTGTRQECMQAGGGS